MELDELKASWQSLDRRVDAAHRDQSPAADRDDLAQGALATGAGTGRRGAEHDHRRVFALVWGKFWSAHLAIPAVAVAGIALHLASIGLIVIGVVRLVLVLRINYTQPVLTIQRSLATLQEFEARSFHAVWFACWVLVPAALVAIVMGFAGVDLWERASGFILANFVVCLAGGLAPPLLHYWARRHPGRLAAWMDAFLLSHSIARAKAAIAEIDEFARS